MRAMDREGQVEAIIKRLPNLSLGEAKEYVNRYDALRHKDTGFYWDPDDTDLIYENLVLPNLAYEIEREKVNTIWTNDSPDIGVASLDLENFIRPVVEAIRLKLFGSATPKWKEGQYDEAVAWIRATEKRSSKKITKKHGKRLAELRKQARKIALEFGEIRGICPPDFVERIEHLVWVEPDGTHAFARARVDTELGYLAERVQAIARYTGLTKPSVLSHILVGSRLQRVPAKLEVTAEGFCRVTFHTPDVKAEQMEGIRKWIKEQWGSAGRKSFTEKDLKLLKAMKRRGWLPDEGKDAFWMEIATDMGVTSRQGASGRYKRILDRSPTSRIDLSDLGPS